MSGNYWRRDETTRVAYTNGVPTGVNTYSIIDTTESGWPANFFALNDIVKVTVDVEHDEDFIYTWSKSDDRGATWVDIGIELVVDPGGGTTYREFDVAPYRDFRLQVSNGGVGQGVWQVDTVLLSKTATPGPQGEKGDPGVGAADVRSGILSPAAFGGDPMTAAVVFSSALPSALYAVTLGYESATFFDFMMRWGNRTTTGFDIVLGTNNLGGLSSVSWHVIPPT